MCMHTCSQYIYLHMSLVVCVCVVLGECVCVLGYVFLTRCTHEWCPYLVLEVISSHTSPSWGGGGTQTVADTITHSIAY